MAEPIFAMTVLPEPAVAVMVTLLHVPSTTLEAVGTTGPEENAPWLAKKVPAKLDWAAVGVSVPVVRLRPQITMV